MYSYAKINSTGTWQLQTSKSWASADPQTGTSATAWVEQIRLHHYSKGKINQGAITKVSVLAKTNQVWGNAIIRRECFGVLGFANEGEREGRGRGFAESVLFGFESSHDTTT